MIAKISTDKELEEFKSSIKGFIPNKFNYKNRIGIIINDYIYYIADHSASTFVEDFFHPDHYIIGNDGYKIVRDLKIRNNNKTFDITDVSTWVICESIYPRDISGASRRTYDKEMLDANSVNIYTKSGNIQQVSISEERLIELGFVKGQVNKEYWFYKTEMKDLDKLLPYKKFDHTFNKIVIEDVEKDPYLTRAEKSKMINEASKTNIKFGVESLTYQVFEGIEYTYGIEIETCIGRPPEKEITELNLKAVHDGSLRDENNETPGGEYVTGVLKGDSGLVQLHEICRVLSSSCAINNKCGVHVHVGSLDWNKENIVYSYILAEILEDEIFAILPKSRRNNSYCRNLTPLTLKSLDKLIATKGREQYSLMIDDLYDTIYKEVTFIKGDRRLEGGATFNDEDGDRDTVRLQTTVSNRTTNRDRQHPLGAKCGYNKDAQRYCWLNYVTLLYNTKGGKNSKTLEFRPHSATMNFNKIRNWTKICFAFCRFVEDYKSLINTGKVSLEDVIAKVYPKTGESLIKYIKERKQVFTTQSESIDYVEEVIPKKKSIKEVVCV